MPLTVNHDICASCGSCVGNCPNRAIVRRSGRTIITDMCCDCGMCLQYCTVGAIGKGSTPATLDSQELAAALSEKLTLSKKIAAMSFTDSPPEGVPVESGPHFWCGMCGDVFDGEADPLFFTAEASTCGGCANVGLGAKRVTREDMDAALDGMVIGEGHLYATREEMAKNRHAFPLFNKTYKGVVIGPLEKVARPDLVIFPLNGHQLCMISTAYAFDTGELIHGFAGKATCLMSIPTPLMGNQPVFCAGDHGGRMFMRLADEEILVCFPFRLVPGLVRNLDKTIFAATAD